MAELVAVGDNWHLGDPRWRSPDLPAPTITAKDPRDWGGSGWLLVELDPDLERADG